MPIKKPSHSARVYKALCFRGCRAAALGGRGGYAGNAVFVHRGGMVFDANLLQIAVVGALGLVLAVAFFNKTAEESLRSTLFTWLLLAPWG